MIYTRDHHSKSISVINLTYFAFWRKKQKNKNKQEAKPPVLVT